MFYQLQTTWEFIFLAVILGAFVFVCFFKIKKAAWLTIFLLPVYLIKFKFGVISITLLDSFLVLLIISFLVKNWRDKKRLAILFGQKKIWLLFLFVGVSFLTSLLAYHNLRALGLFKSVVVLPLLAGFVFAYYFYSDKKNIVKLLIAPLFASSFLVALIALGYKISGVVSFDNRVAAFWQSPNQLAMYLSLGVLAGVFLFKKQRMLAGIGLAFILTALFFTFSLGAWLAVWFAVLSVWSFSFFKNKKALVGVFWGLYLLVFLLLIFTGGNLTGLLGDSFASRVIIWQTGKEIITENIWLGIGLGGFQDQYLGLQERFTPYPEWAVPHAHNLWLDALLSFGVVGFCLFIFLFFGAFWGALKEKNSFFLFFVFYTLVYGLADEPIFRNDLAVVFWIFIVFCFFVSSSRQETG